MPVRNRAQGRRSKPSQGGDTEVGRVPRILFRPHALDRAGECEVDEAALRRCIAVLSPRLAPFAGIKGKIGLMYRAAPSPVVHPIPRGFEVITVLRPGQRAVCPDTIEVWVE